MTHAQQRWQAKMPLNALLVGSLLIVTTVLTHVIGLMLLTFIASRLSQQVNGKRLSHRLGVMVAIVLGLFGIVSIEVWTWAGSYLLLGVSPNWEEALYLSTATFATVGYGDVVPAQPWRVLAALEGITGFLMIGWSTAFLVTAGVRFGPFRSGEHF